MPKVPDDDIDVTELLAAWSEGDPRALGELMPAVYDDMRRIARRQLRREGAMRAFQTTELVHEAFARLVGQDRVVWRDRKHFLAIAASMMRRCLLDEARARLALKRGQGAVHVPLEQAPGVEQARELVALHESLSRLETVDPVRGAVVMLRVFAGLSVAESAEVLGCSRATVLRHWKLAKAWLYRDMKRALST